MLFEIYLALCTLIKLQLLGCIAVLITLKTKIPLDERNLIDLAIVQCLLRTRLLLLAIQSNQRRVTIVMCQTSIAFHVISIRFEVR